VVVEGGRGQVGELKVDEFRELVGNHPVAGREQEVIAAAEQVLLGISCRRRAAHRFAPPSASKMIAPPPALLPPRVVPEVESPSSRWCGAVAGVDAAVLPQPLVILVGVQYSELPAEELSLRVSSSAHAIARLTTACSSRG